MKATHFVSSADWLEGQEEVEQHGECRQTIVGVCDRAYEARNILGWPIMGQEDIGTSELELGFILAS